MPLVGTAVGDVESKLRRRYGKNDRAIYGTLNKIGLMRGNKVTKKGLKKPKDKKHSLGRSLSVMSRGKTMDRDD